MLYHVTLTSSFGFASNKILSLLLVCLSSSPEPAESEPPASQQSFTDSPPPSPDTPEERQIVTLVVEEEEEEDQRHKQSTVTLMEEEDDEKREEEEQTRRSDPDRNHWDGQTYCPFSSFSSLSLSCVATLPELLHRWCSARLAKERLRSVKRRQLGTQMQPEAEAAPSTGTPQQSPVAVPTLVKEPTLPLTEATAEVDIPAAAPIDAAASVNPESHTAAAQTDAREEATPELSLFLEPSRTVSLPPHSFSNVPSSPPEMPPPVKVAAPDARPTPTLQVVAIPETQQASSATPSLTINPPQQQVAGTEATVVVPPATEQLIQALPTASRPDEHIPPPTELPPPLPASATDTQTDSVASGLDGRETQGAQLPQANGEQADRAPAEPQRVEEAAVEEDLLTAVGNGHMPRSATDFYAELQNGGDYGGGAMNGNGLLMNGGAVHGSSQKESVFMRLNNRIKALEMNMSLSSRYLEELSQRYSHRMQQRSCTTMLKHSCFIPVLFKSHNFNVATPFRPTVHSRYRKQMEEMQKAFNKTIIKLQNTSRIAQEQVGSGKQMTSRGKVNVWQLTAVCVHFQDQKQTDSIHVLQSQLENVTRLMLNLTATVGQLQREVSPRPPPSGGRPLQFFSPFFLVVLKTYNQHIDV